MVHPLVGIHAGLGELGVFAFLWVLVELLNPTESRVKRAKIVSVIGLIFFLLSWVAGGFYYVNYYGKNVKPLIKEGPQPWAHKIFMETKEHLFLFLPFLSILASLLIFHYGNKLMEDKKAQLSLLLLLGLIILIGLSMVGMGYLISSGARTALEGGGLT